MNSSVRRRHFELNVLKKQSFRTSCTVNRIKMFRGMKFFAFSFALVSIVTIINAQLPGGYSTTPTSGYGDLEIKLDNSNMATALGGQQAFIIKILSASQQVVAGMNYKIEAKVCVNGHREKCCFKAFQSLSGTFTVNCAQCKYVTCSCFN